MKPSYDIAVVGLHPIQYQAGLWRTMAAHPRLRVKVLYLDRMGVDGTVEPDTGHALKWDLPLLDGYDYAFVPNLSPARFTIIINRINPTLLATLLRGQYDAIMVHGYMALSNWLALAAAQLQGAALIYRGEGSLLRPLAHPPLLLKPKEQVHRFFLERCQAVAYSSRDNHDYHLVRGAAPEAMFPMPCAVDNELLAQCAEVARPEELRARLRIGPGAKVAITAGRFAPHKRIGDVIEALAQLDDQRDAPQLLIAGTGPDEEQLRVLAAERGVAERVHFLGFVKQAELVEAMLASDVFVMASSQDNSPKAMSEALAMGLPVVCSDKVGTCEDLIDHGKNGYAYSCGDVAALAGHLRQVLTVAEPERQAMREAARETAARNDFSTSVMALLDKLDSLEAP